ncbi:hypothetical protein OGAPHI_003956 [Ogataea philodendri]|uniref:Transmembrane protein 115 n=1 Tax=Ogataea philodendri TaxID=1378263 RepID=A0A9P8P4R3_9ASCO|nr:uncharacterized protein OGAPHI_003956 [Ogataea philodendri]KAH3665768.1 hypothetical protein OGAPHI_003956 [Ogataea philodendri]
MSFKFKSLEFPIATTFFLSLTTILSLLKFITSLQTYNGIKAEHPEVSFSEIIVPILQLVPSQSIFYPWTFVTESFVEWSILTYALSVVVLYFGINFLEKHWNVNNESRVFSETVYFIIIVATVTNITTVLIEITVHMLSLSSSELTVPLKNGIFSLIMSFVVVLKQLTPEHNVKVFKTFSIRLRQLPFIVLSATLFVSIVTRSLKPVVPMFNNFYVSWFYLRYYQINTINDLLPSNSSRSTVRGDASDTFAFIQFFPVAAHRVLKPISRTTYHTAALIGLIRPFNDDDIESGNLRTIKRLNTASTTVTSEIADRRRQVALQVLGERVNANTNARPDLPETPEQTQN